MMTATRSDQKLTQLEQTMVMLEQEFAELEAQERAGTLSLVALQQFVAKFRKWYLRFQHAVKVDNKVEEGDEL